jgi:hypothetical protein
MYPPVPLIAKESAEDTQLKTSTPWNPDRTLEVQAPKGIDLTLNIPAMHYNRETRVICNVDIGH